MHKLLLLFVVPVFWAMSPATAQKRLTEGTIHYDIVINTGTDKPQAVDLFDGAATVYLKGSKSRVDMINQLGKQSTLMDAANRSIVVLKEYGEQKYMIQMTPEDWKDANRKYENVTFTYADDTKTILEYTCKKAIGSLPDGTTFIVWYTSDLVPENRNFQYANRTLPGLAMEYESTVGNLKVTYTVSKINTAPVPASRFDLPRSGFRIMTYEESKGQ